MLITNISDLIKNLQKDQPILAIDFGSYKTGIAISDSNQKIAFMKSCILTKSLKEKLTKILSIIKELNPCAIIIGIAYTLANTPTRNTIPTMKFADNLSKITPIPIFLQDERLTTQTVHKINHFYKIKNQKTKEDMLAARLILETVLESIRIYNERTKR